MVKRSNKPYIMAATGIVIVTLSELAAAQSAVPSVSPSAYPSSWHSSVSPNSAAATQLISVTSLRQMQAISNALSARSITSMGTPPAVIADSGQQRFGMAAGGVSSKWNVWGNLSGDNNRYEEGINKFSANATNTVLGGDFALSPTLAVGLSAAYDNVTGDSSVATNYKNTGYSIAPYVGWQINQMFSLDASMGWGEGNMDDANYSTDSDRFFYGINLNFAQWYGNWQVGGKLSYLHGEEKYGDSKNNFGVKNLNSSTKNKVDQWRLGTQVGYWMDGIMPYAGVAYSADSRSISDNNNFDPTSNLGKDAWIWSLGVNLISIKNKLTGGIVYNVETGRAHSNSDNLMANINYRF